jgi:hypothetical protein
MLLADKQVAAIIARAFPKHPLLRWGDSEYLMRLEGAGGGWESCTQCSQRAAGGTYAGGVVLLLKNICPDHLSDLAASITPAFLHHMFTRWLWLCYCCLCAAARRHPPPSTLVVATVLFLKHGYVAAVDVLLLMCCC